MSDDMLRDIGIDRSAIESGFATDVEQASPMPVSDADSEYVSSQSCQSR